MSRSTGLGITEAALLEAFAAAGADSDGPYVKCTHVLAELEAATGIAPRYGYDVLVDLARRWTVPLRLVDFHGNVGAPDFPAASPKYTEARLSPIGVCALAAERNEKPPVPIGLINGTTHAGGSRPPFSPTGIIDALGVLIENEGATDGEILDVVGSPSFPTGCHVGGQVVELLAGLPATLQLTASIEISDAHPSRTRWRGIVLTNLPPGVSTSDLFDHITSRVHRRSDEDLHPELAAKAGLDLKALDDLSSGDEARIVVTPKAGADVEDLADRLRAIWGVSIDLPVNLGQPLATVLRAWIAERPDHDVRAGLAELRSLV
jgi:DNA gyrase/topoisomerase IV subunit A